jgi:hypothetical protein
MRGRCNAAHNYAAAAWTREGQAEGNEMDFARDVLPGLKSVPLRLIAEETGLSQAHCSFVRRGLRVPHPRHWETLAALGRTERVDCAH